MKALVLRPDHIGDMVLTTPFLASLRNSFPDREVAVLCGSWACPVLENNPNYDTAIICDFPWLARGGRRSWRPLIRTVSALRHERFDVVFNLRKAAKTAAVARLIGGGTVLGFDVGKSLWAHTKTIHYRTDIHIADLYVEFALAAGGTIRHNRPEMFFSEEERIDFSGRVALPFRYIVFAPGAGYPEKLWYPDRWTSTADALAKECNVPIVFTGSAAESDMISKICENSAAETINYAGKLTIRESAQLIEKAEFAVSLDSAAMHLASAVKTPVIALFGPTNPVHWGPYPNGRANQIVSKVKGFSLGRGSTNKSGGMELILVDDVMKAADRLIAAERLTF